MEITFILKGAMEALPPMLPRILHVAQQGISVNLICTKTAGTTKEILTQHGISYQETLHKEKFCGKDSRIRDWTGFKRSCKKILKSTFPNTDLLYICSADTAICLNSLLNRYEYVLQSNELYDQLPLYRYGLKKYAAKAKGFVVPEFCRANICMQWYGLKKTPYVIPNIPYILSTEPKQKIRDENAEAIINQLSDRKILIYQGHIQVGDRSLSAVAEALKRINNREYALVLMGRNHNHSFEQLQQIYNETYYIPFIPAPYHLAVTSHAHIALLSYDRVSLNNLFCAPNKIYEYSCLGIPMLGNDIPGLTYTIDYEKMGVCCAYEDVDAVVAAIEKIEYNHKEYSQNAKDFYQRSDLYATMDILLKEVLGDGKFEPKS